MKNVNLNAIRIDGGTQARASLNESAVAEYADDLASLPPVLLFNDGSEQWLADGFHRYHAYRKAGKASIPAEIRSGTRRDAILYAVGANTAHGLRRTNEDKRRAVRTLLDDAEWATWSDRKIAEACGVGHPFVASLRNPEVAAKQQANRQESNAKKSGGVESDSTGSRVSAPAPAPALAPKPAALAPAEDFGPDAAELAAQAAAEEADRLALANLLESDDKLATAVAEVKRLNAVNAALQSSLNGQMAKNNELIRQIKALQRKLDKVPA